MKMLRGTLMIAGALALSALAGAASAQTPAFVVVDERADQLFSMMEHDLKIRTGMNQVEITAIDIYNQSVASIPGTTTYCGWVRYDGGPEVPFVIRSEPSLVIQVALRFNVPEDRAAWTGAGCGRDGSVFMARPVSMF